MRCEMTNSVAVESDDFLTLGDPPTAQAKITVIEHHRLSRRDRAKLLREVYARVAVGERRYRCRNIRGAGADAGLDFDRSGWRDAADPVNALGGEFVAFEVGGFADDDAFREGIHVDHVHSHRA